jgi:DNA repair protein RecN (Recombination protein N)|nr:DNA repair protein RecN [uncultured Prevotella sp.]
MLKQLYIRNFTLIDELDIKLYPGFSVITGETGAGKSIILGAIGLLLGNRADSKAIKSGKERCVIEAHFDLSRYDMKGFFDDNDIDFDAEDTIIRRELTSAGKSRAFINDTPVPLTKMRELGEQLVDIHSQHQNLLLQKEDFQLNVVDILAQDAEHIKAYQAVYQQYRSALSQLEQLKQELIKNRENEEFMRFQHKELDEAHLEPGELEQLEQESDILNHSEEIKSALYEADHSLSDDEGSILQLLRNASYSISNIREIYPEVAELSDRLDSSYIELKDIAQEISSSLDRIDFDPARLEQLNTRLDQLNTLLQKFHVETVEELIETRDLLAQQLEHIDNGNEDIEILQKEVDQKLIKAMSAAHSLSSLRKKVAKSIETEMKNRLVPLGIPNVRFEIEFAEKPLCRDGADKVSFLFSANRSTPLQPISQVASGGEIARVMLSLKAMISGAVKLPTIIFDEIDTGVSGKIAEKMAEIMTEMGNQNRQVISITHLPQIAAMGSHHYKVMKEETQTGTISQMRELTPEQRVEEIAQMLSGSDISQAALANAKELINKHAKL